MKTATIVATPMMMAAAVRNQRQGCSSGGRARSAVPARGAENLILWPSPVTRNDRVRGSSGDGVSPPALKNVTRPCRGDVRLHPSHPDQIGRVRLAGECPVGLDSPGGQSGSQRRGRPPRPVAGSSAGLIRRAAREPAASARWLQSGKHARGGVDLQRDRSLNEGLASPRTNFQMML
jgi:hypothetical protein